MKRGRSTPRRKAFALALTVVAVLGISAISASGAQALTWQGPGTTILSGGETESIASLGSVTITSTVLGAPTQIHCGASNSGSIGASGGGSATISLNECSVETPSHCELVPAPTLKANVALVEVGGKLYQKFTPAEGAMFGEFAYKGNECPFNEATVPLSGSFAGFEVSTEMSETHTVSFAKGEPWPEVQLKFGKVAATISGKLAGQRLSGVLANHLWRPLWQGTHGAWEVESGSPLGTESARVAGGPVSFSFSLLGSPISFTCSEPGAAWATLHPGGTESFENISFSGCSVEPATCALRGNRIQFPEMTGTLMSVGGKAYEKFSATHPIIREGQEEPIMEWSFEGPTCPFSGISMPVRKSIVALGPELGGLRRAQPFEFSKAATETLLESERLRVGKWSTVNMGGSLKQELSGSGTGVPWGAY